MNKMYDYEKEKETWFKNYLKYDNNQEHAELAFISNGYNIENLKVAEQLHEDNEEFLRVYGKLS